MAIKSLCVYCGSNFNGDIKFKLAVQAVARVMFLKQINLVYGGGKVGLMGLIADEVLKNGGEVTGIIPAFLMQKEVGHTGLTKLIITENMHQRKQKMADLSDGFLILPGGFGTLEEFFEVVTWLQLGLHHKPIGVLDVDGFYNMLFAQLDVMVTHQFLKKNNRDLIFYEKDPETLINKMNNFSATPDEVWFKKSDRI